MIQIVSLDDPNVISPVAHVYIESAISFASIDDGLPRYKGLPCAEEFARLKKSSQYSRDGVTGAPACSVIRRISSHPSDDWYLAPWSIYDLPII